MSPGYDTHKDQLQRKGVAAQHGQADWTVCKSLSTSRLVSPRSKTEPIRSTTLPEVPWGDIAVDLLEIPSGSHLLVNHLLVVVDNYRISSNKRRPQINAAPESQNINKRRPRINAAPLGAAFIQIFNKKLVYLKGSWVNVLPWSRGNTGKPTQKADENK